MKNYIVKLIKFLASHAFQYSLIKILIIISTIIGGAYFYKRESTISSGLMGLFVGFICFMGFMFILFLFLLLINFLKKQFSVLKDVIYVILFVAALLAAAIFISKYL
jgi:hypothetical protein